MRLILVPICSIPLAVSLYAATCDNLTSLKISETTITSAQTVAAGAFLPPNARADSPAAVAYKNLPSFCRVEGFAAPTNDSRIEFEVWLPTAGCNGKYLGVGNGEFA